MVEDGDLVRHIAQHPHLRTRRSARRHPHRSLRTAPCDARGRRPHRRRAPRPRLRPRSLADGFAVGPADRHRHRRGRRRARRRRGASLVPHSPRCDHRRVRRGDERRPAGLRPGHGAADGHGGVALGDRYDNRKLLAGYYGFRALSLFALPLIYDVKWLLLFAFVYGLDWIATVPPTANLVATIYGRASVGTIYGWIFFSHMLGAAIAAFAGGFFRDLLGDYHLMFVSAGTLGFIAVALALRISPSAVTRMPTVALEAARP